MEVQAHGRIHTQPCWKKIIQNTVKNMYTPKRGTISILSSYKTKWETEKKYFFFFFKKICVFVFSFSKIMPPETVP